MQLKADCVWGEKNGILARVCLADNITKRRFHEQMALTQPRRSSRTSTPRAERSPTFTEGHEKTGGKAEVEANLKSNPVKIKK